MPKRRKRVWLKRPEPVILSARQHSHRRVNRSMESVKDEVVIIGAGPYGLSLAAHFGKVGIPHRVFGQPMSYSDENMPKGMFLRSSWDASHIASPGNDLTLDSFQKDQHLSITRPIPLETFVRYGRWVQERVATDVDARSMLCVEKDDHGLRITLDDGERINARKVVIATGLGPFAWRPERVLGPSSGIREPCFGDHGHGSIVGQVCRRDRRRAECHRDGSSCP